MTRTPRRPVVWVNERTPPAEVEALRALADVRIFAADGPLPDAMGPADLVVAAGDAARAIEVASRIPAPVVLQTFSAGIDSIIDRIPPGVILCDAAGVHDVAVAEWVVLAILAAQRRLPEHLDAQRRSTWGPSLRGSDLVDAVVVVVGAGAIGRAVEARLHGFGARIERVARRPRDGVHGIDDLPVLLATADVVVSLLPLTDATRGLADQSFFGAMRPGALFVNASRGKVVDTAALTAAVLAGHIRAALDVTDPEPLPADHPLWTAPGVIITPHAASDVASEADRAWRLVRDQIVRLARGELPINVVVDGY